MDYTTSLDNVVHGATGRRMHSDSIAVPTVWSGNDANMVIWSMMEMLKLANVAGQAFNPDDEASYTRFREALLKVFAKLDSPDFAGKPTAPTPPLYDATRKIATMEALATAGVRFGAFGSISGNYDLAITDLPKIIAVQANGQTITLPPVTNAHIGVVQKLFVYPGTTNTITVKCVAGQQVSTATTLSTSLTVSANGFTDFVWEGTATQHWEVGGAGVMDKIPAFGASLGATGYQKLPSGLIFQWGGVSGVVQPNSSEPFTWTFPLAFPNACLIAMTTPSNNVGTGRTLEGWSRVSASGFYGNNGSLAQTLKASCFAIGY
ncbi:phage tail protein [Burkholderia multivorans]|uniref:gp53-like domain-containing protein n=1 Tax=Burkholderia multivorans TaxID=87883 RepID=UPI002B24838A|nr:phage tail protein [Burkholderia multivorans]MEB2508919.1 phage tail protein [Burkholderia multivorans]MEB2520010.1 phage tail protein [Burkholderia multivorans]MEB2572495.1 phage tail protein [Burkholderia multivorans]MEB2590345.1 phage tail protein [Burkholderia multivorans]